MKYYIHKKYKDNYNLKIRNEYLTTFEEIILDNEYINMLEILKTFYRNHDFVINPICIDFYKNKYFEEDYLSKAKFLSCARGTKIYSKHPYNFHMSLGILSHLRSYDKRGYWKNDLDYIYIYINRYASMYTFGEMKDFYQRSFFNFLIKFDLIESNHFWNLQYFKYLKCIFTTEKNRCTKINNEIYNSLLSYNYQNNYAVLEKKLKDTKIFLD